MPLIIRTNIIGFRGRPDSPTFIEWVLKALKNHDELTLFDDYFTSGIDTTYFSTLLRDLIKIKAHGIVNIGSRYPVSKREFILLLAHCLDLDTSKTKIGSIGKLGFPIRAESLGLDCRKAENLLGQKMPRPENIASRLAKEYKEQTK